MSEFWCLRQSERYGVCLDEGQQLSWLEHTTDNREVGGSSPLWPTTSSLNEVLSNERISLSEKAQMYLEN